MCLPMRSTRTKGKMGKKGKTVVLEVQRPLFQCGHDRILGFLFCVPAFARKLGRVVTSCDTPPVSALRLEHRHYCAVVETRIEISLFGVSPSHFPSFFGMNHSTF